MSKRVEKARSQTGNNKICPLKIVFMCENYTVFYVKKF